MIERFRSFPAALTERSRTVRLGPSGVPALLAHPDGKTPAPVMLWMHGRTANKELDPGRYLRWIRAGIAACAIDLPSHGERFDPAMQTDASTLEVLAQGVGEVDGVVAALGAEHGGVFDTSRMGIGGMSAGGMIALRRLCEPHAFRCAAVEGTTGDLSDLYGPRGIRRERIGASAALYEAMDPVPRIHGWRPIPLLALHSEKDAMVPVESQRRFIGALREHYREELADPAMIEFVTWPETGAPDEHIGFGRVSNEAKNLQTEFLKRWLLG